MALIERDDFLAVLHNRFSKVAEGEGHSFFITGEAGIGKTSLVRTFLKQVGDDCIEYAGACDSLFTPRPLAPLYDLALQIKEDWAYQIHATASVPELFTRFIQQITQQTKPVILVFEDIHWADEATLDFVKFFARRISRTKCMFILTYRDDEVVGKHPLRNVLGDLAPDTFTRMQLTPLSLQAVHQLADGLGYDADDVFNISGGNPFYINEILASYSTGIPENVKDSVLSVYNRHQQRTKDAWQLLSVIPEGLEIHRLSVIEPLWNEAIEHCLESKIVIIKNDRIHFKHELYRRAIEGALSPFKRIALNKRLLDLFLEDFEAEGEIERIVHYAKNANENALVVRYAPMAATKAACVGAHIEASKLLFSAIEYSDKKDIDKLVTIYEDYAYECYLTNQMKEAIIYQTKALKIFQEKASTEKIGNSLRFLSRLWWFEGNFKQAELYGSQAIEVLEGQPFSKARAMAYSNMAQLKMLSDESEECAFWGKKAISIAEEMDDAETLAHALNSVGSDLMTAQSSMSEGITLLKQSLEIALDHHSHEHVARAYCALGSNGVTMKDYSLAKKYLEEGINYCEQRNLDSLKLYMIGWKTRLDMETGHWQEAYTDADHLLKKENLVPVIKIGVLVVAGIIRARRGEQDALALLVEARDRAFETKELQRIMPALAALIEYEWITGKEIVATEVLDRTIRMIGQLEKVTKRNRLYYWLRKARVDYLPVEERYEGYGDSSVDIARAEAASWLQLGCPYEQALALADGDDDDKRNALLILQQLGAHAVYEKVKMGMRSSGMKKIPRGARESTRGNPAQLTNRELDVLQLLKKGVQNREIAGTLFISPKTVDNHISSILFKLEVNSRSKAVAEAVRLGAIPA